jgi:hypothetical protein
MFKNRVSEWPTLKNKCNKKIPTLCLRWDFRPDKATYGRINLKLFD